MNRLKYLIIGILALIMAGCGQTVVESIKVPESAGPNAPGAGKTIVVLPFADYTYEDELVSAHRRSIQIIESLTDRLAVNGFSMPIQEDVFQYMLDQNLISLAAYEESYSSSLKDEFDNDWSSEMKKQLSYYMNLQQSARKRAVAASPGTHGLTGNTVRKIGRHFQADYIVRGRILEYKTRQDPTWEPWRKGILPFVFGGTSQLFYGFAGTDEYDEWNQITAGATWGALLGYDSNWPFDPDGGDTIFGASGKTSGAVFWGLAGGYLGNLASKSGRVDQAVVQMRIWVQEAATGNVVWTNRVKVQVSPESIYADNQYDTLFDSAITKGVTSLVDNFVTYGL